MLLGTFRPCSAIKTIGFVAKQSKTKKERSFMSTIITSPIEPISELQSEEGVRIYQSKLSELSRSDLCTELSNVMAAKNNLMMVPSSPAEVIEKQKIVSDLTDKAATICILEFGKSVIFGWGNGDLQPFNALLNDFDHEIAKQDREPSDHGHCLLYALNKFINE